MLVAIANPAAGRGQALTVAEDAGRALSERGLGVVIRATETAGQATDLAEEASRSGDVQGLLVAGGDGTFHEVVNGLMRCPQAERPPLTLLAAGSGNSLARDLDQLDPGATVRRLCEGTARPRALDVLALELDGRSSHAFNIVGWGLAAAAGARAERLRWLGESRYTAASVIELLRRRRHEATLRADGRETTGEHVLVLGCNTRHTGTGMQMAPAAELDDGLVDLLVVRRASALTLLRLLAKVYDGRHVGSPVLEYRQVSGFSLRQAKSQWLLVDGEVTRAREVAVRVVPRALRVMG